MEKLSNFINGAYLAPLSGKYIDNFEPATGKVYSLIPDSDAADVELAVEAASNAFPLWSNMGIEERGKILKKLSEGIEANMDAFVAAESKDNGKPLSLAKHVDIPRAVSNFHFFATAIEHFASESHQMEGVGFNYTTRKPIGVVGCISPWNLPLYLFSWKIAPALAAGNCVIAKPSEVTPYTAYMLGKIAKEAGMQNHFIMRSDNGHFFAAKRKSYNAEWTVNGRSLKNWFAEAGDAKGRSVREIAFVYPTQSSEELLNEIELKKKSLPELEKPYWRSIKLKEGAPEVPVGAYLGMDLEEMFKDFSTEAVADNVQRAPVSTKNQQDREAWNRHLHQRMRRGSSNL